MSKRDAQEIRSYKKRAQTLLHQGKPKYAESYLFRAYEITDSLPRSERNATRAFLIHRLAEVAVQQNEPMLARRRFRESLKITDTTNTMGHARTLRDYGEFLRRQGEVKAGRREVERALSIMDLNTDRSARLEIELLVTDGILARFDCLSRKRRDDAIETQYQIAKRLRGYKKTEYELAVLRFLLEEVIPFYNPERVEYIGRAIFLSTKQGNLKKVGEYISLLGGSPSQILYNRVVR